METNSNTSGEVNSDGDATEVNLGVDELFAPLDGVAIEEIHAPLPDDHVEVIFRHSQAARFRVGKFQFNDHLLRIVGPRPKVIEDRRLFAELVAGLMQVDRRCITQLKTPPSLAELVSRRVTGPVSTSDIPDKQATISPAKPTSGLNFGRK